MNPSALTPPQRVAVLGVIDPQSVAAGSNVTSQWVSMAGPNRLLATVMLGALVAGGTVDAKLQQATRADGTGTKDAGRALSQIAGATGSNKQAHLHIEDEDLDLANGYAFIRLVVTVGGQAAQVAALLQGFDFREMPASDNQVATVVQNVG